MEAQCVLRFAIIDYTFVYIEAVFVALRSEEIGVATLTGWNQIDSKWCQHLPRPKSILYTNQNREDKGHPSDIFPGEAVLAVDNCFG